MKNYYEAFQPAKDAKKVSAPGEYSGYSSMVYDGYQRFSEYVTMRDGCKLAVTYYRPTLNGVLVETPLPVIWRYTPYGSVMYNKDGSIHNTVFFTGDGAGMGPHPKVPDDYLGCEEIEGMKIGADLMIRVFTGYGYVVAQADVRGKFASFGFRRSANSDDEVKDGYEINEWLASRPWCTGKTGMFGSSYTGQTQLEVLRTCPPSLKAAMICMTDIDKFDGWAMGGIPRGGDFNMCPPDNVPAIVPVDADKDGSLLAQALEQHKRNKQDIPVDESVPRHLPYYQNGRLPYRDSFSKASDTRYWIQDSASTHLAEINASGAAVYLIGGWYDVFRRDTTLLFNNLTLPKKLIFGPWYHTRFKKELNLLVEHMRFYDFWLKGIENGVMDEPPIYLKTMNGETGVGESWQDGWQFAEKWPLPNTKKLELFLGENGTLTAGAPAVDDAADAYLSDYTVGDWEEQDYADEILSKGLIYTGEVLTEPVTAAGHPIVELNYTSNGKDGDFFVFLLDADDEHSHIVSIGRLRASFRLTENAPYNFIGLPWHPCYEKDVQMPTFENGPIRLTIDMKPVNYTFKPGHRIRLAITTSMSRFQYYQETPAPTVQIQRNTLYPSRIELTVKK